MTDNIIYNKILKALELICPLYTNNLITEALIVGSVAKGTAKEESDIDIYLIHTLFKAIELRLGDSNFQEQKMIDNLLKRGVIFKQLEIKEKLLMWYHIYKDELFHLMVSNESESIRAGGNFIELTKEFCEIVKIK